MHDGDPQDVVLKHAVEGVRRLPKAPRPQTRAPVGETGELRDVLVVRERRAASSRSTAARGRPSRAATIAATRCPMPAALGMRGSTAWTRRSRRWLDDSITALNSKLVL
jgi:hypothetical protein